MALDAEVKPSSELAERALDALVLEWAHPPAPLADEVVVMLSRGVSGLVARRALARLEPVKEAEALEQLEGPIDGRDADVTALRPQAIGDLAGGEHALVASERLDDGHPWGARSMPRPPQGLGRVLDPAFHVRRGRCLGDHDPKIPRVRATALLTAGQRLTRRLSVPRPRSGRGVRGRRRRPAVTIDRVEYALALLVLLALVAVFVSAPLRRDERALEAAEADRRGELEAAKELKYREIRDAELDFRMGKVSEADHRATDRELRAQAIAILEQLDALEDDRAPSSRDEP